MSTAIPGRKALSLKRIIHTWWPLAASWLLMSLELPAVSAVVARLADPEINLAAYGGVVFPLALIIESPIIMLLAASTALSKDWDSYARMRRFMMWAGAILTGVHLLVALTPLYYVVVEGIIGVPPEIVEPARIGLVIMTPWTWTIAYRRFNQGVLIRFDHSRAVGIGTLVRLGSNWLVLAAGYLIGTLPGIVVATAAIATGVTGEALYVGIRVRPVLRDELKLVPPVSPPLTFDAFMAFYIPLVLTSLLQMLVQPIGSMALSRMPQALDSLAVWPVVSGLVFMLRSMGVAFNEVVVALIEDQDAVRQLRRFSLFLALGTTGLLFLIVATPLSVFWFVKFSSLPPSLASMARQAIWLALPLPAVSVLQSWYQGVILNSKRTRGITEAIVIFLAVMGLLLGLGVLWSRLPGLYIGLGAMTIGMSIQAAWLWVRSRTAIHAVLRADTLPEPAATLPAESPAR